MGQSKKQKAKAEAAEQAEAAKAEAAKAEAAKAEAAKAEAAKAEAAEQPLQVLGKSITAKGIVRNKGEVVQDDWFADPKTVEHLIEAGLLGKPE